MIKNYKLIELPLKKHIYETNEKEAQEFFSWFGYVKYTIYKLPKIFS